MYIDRYRYNLNRQRQQTIVISGVATVGIRGLKHTPPPPLGSGGGPREMLTSETSTPFGPVLVTPLVMGLMGFMKFLGKIHLTWVHRPLKNIEIIR